MRIVDVYLRGKKFFAVGKKGSGAVYVEATPPFVADDTEESVCELIGKALETSIIPSHVPDAFPFTSGLARAAGVKDESAFRRGVTMGTVREADDGFDILRGEKAQGGWHARVVKTLPRTASPMALAVAVRAVLHGNFDED